MIASPRSTAGALIAATAVVLASRAAQAADHDASDVTAVGLHAGLTQVRGGDKNAQLGALGLVGSHVGFGYERPWTVRAINTASLAGGAKGIEGGFANVAAAGLRVPLGTTHGVIVRAGGEGSFFGNKYIWNSLLELPQGQLGYQWLARGSVVDLAMKGGYVLLGRHNTGDAGVRDLDGAAEWGAIVALSLGSVNLRASSTRMFPRRDGGPLLLAEAAACADAAAIVICTESRYERGDARLADGVLRDARVTYVGMTLGLLLLEAKPKKR